MSSFFIKDSGISFLLVKIKMIAKTMYVISVDDERYISETVKEVFGCGGEITEIEMRLSLTYSILEAKHFYSEGDALAFLETDKFKNAWRWNHDFLIPKHYYIKEVEIEFFEKIIKTITVEDEYKAKQ